MLGKPLPPRGDFGESWELSGHPHHVSRVAEGPLKGRLLSDMWRTMGPQLAGRPVGPDERFPLLLKYLDCRDLLSVQVHPNDAAARRLIGDELGKTEAWVVIHAEPNSRVFAGLKPGIGRLELEQHLDDGTIADCLHAFVPQAGDCLLLRAGTVHAVGGGVLLAEVQQTSDATFRLFDWNRVGADGKPRALHRGQALESIDWTLGPVEPLRSQMLPEGGGGGRSGELLAACPYFELRRYRLERSLSHPLSIGEAWNAERMTMWMLLEGCAELRTADGYGRRFKQGETVLVPAAANQPSWRRAGDSDTILLAVAAA
jgi:mannose-6-phosphate isomerase